LYESNVRSSMFGLWRVVQLVLWPLNGAISILGTISGPPTRFWCANSGPQWEHGRESMSCRPNVTLALAACRAKHAALRSYHVGPFDWDLLTYILMAS